MFRDQMTILEMGKSRESRGPEEAVICGLKELKFYSKNGVGRK